ncbi:hypothetical protein OIO90_002328 [Microbotryomycetes sp. JL221]|nr:hypothetical protein OIO90_002328 [Microbotryomycetes sp. JL221]
MHQSTICTNFSSTTSASNPLDRSTGPLPNDQHMIQPDSTTQINTNYETERIQWSKWPLYGSNCASWHLERIESSENQTFERFVRPLGILEYKFDQAALKQGMSDTFLRIKVNCQSSESLELIERFKVAWCRLRQTRPLLACTIHDVDDELLETDQNRSNWTWLPYAKKREFRFQIQHSEQERIQQALKTIDIRQTNYDPIEIANGIQTNEVLNGPRSLLDQETCLAKLLIVQDTRQHVSSHSHQLFLVVAHAISDGLSVLSTVRELFDFVSQGLKLDDVSQSLEDQLDRLPPSTEALYLPLPLASEQEVASVPIRNVPKLEGLDLAGQVKSLNERTYKNPTMARQRWFWAISRLRTIKRQRECPIPKQLKRRLPKVDTQARTEWKTKRLDQTLSQKVIELCKRESISPSMLLYSVLGISVANQLYSNPQYPQASTDLAIRITFGQIVLPGGQVVVEPSDLFKFRVLQGAKLSKKQFINRFKVQDRGFFLADTYMRTLDRLLHSTGHNSIPLREPKTAFNASMIGDVDRLVPKRFALSGTDRTIELSDLSIGTRLHWDEGMLCAVSQHPSPGSTFVRFWVSRTRSIDITNMLTGDQVAKHNSKDDLWMIINGKVYDLTTFAPEHPGGMKVLIKYAGKDATAEYEPIHPPGTIEDALPKDKHLGPVDMGTVAKVVIQETKAPIGPPTSLNACLNVADIEAAAETLLKPKAFAYYASAADDEQTKNWNHDSFSKIRFRPRVLRDVTNANLSTTILGHPSTLPFFIAPAAMGRLAHPDGEKHFARLAREKGIPYMVSANSSVGFEELAQIAGPQAHLIYQLYVNRDRTKTEAVLKRVVEAGYKAICVTVDAPVAGKRERDERSKMDADSAADDSMRDAVSKSEADKPQGIAQNLGSYVDASLSLSDLKWIKQHSNNLPLIVKGIQSVEDAVLCVKAGCQAIYLSNHGGRQLEGAPSSIETLLEIRKHEPQLFNHCQVFLDGGFKRGTDVLKALALGATAVGLGRPYMYSLAFDYEGPLKITQILQDELGQNLRLLGATSINELSSSMLNTHELNVKVLTKQEYELSKKRDLENQGWLGWLKSKL